MEHQLILDRYRPLALLGEGGHGDVTLAFDTRMARRVAVKSIPFAEPREGFGPRAARGAEARPDVEAGLEEARTAALLNHPAIVTVHEWDADETHAHLITEYIDGIDLAGLLDEFGPLDADVAAAVLGPVADALVFAHENGVLHLDVKPENVLISREGRVKLADFGISALTDAAGLTAATAGTLGFMPPEQLRNEELDERADQWAFAALVFETLADANPFEADTLEGAIFRAVDVEPALPTEFEPDLPTAIDDILLAALEPDPDQRYGSIGAFADALLVQLGDAREGEAKLVDMVLDLVGEEDAFDEEALGLWDRLARHAPATRHATAAVLSAWLAWAGMRPLELGFWPTAGVTALSAAAALGAPALGIALGLLVVSAGFFLDGVVAGVVFALAAAAYWGLFGRRGSFPALAPVAAPLFGIGPFSLALPMLLGFGTRPLVAAAAAAWSAAALHVASAINGNAAPFLDVSAGLIITPWAGAGRVQAAADLISAPGVYVSVLSWALAAAIISLFSRSGTRAGAGAGVVLGSLVLVGAYGVWALFDGSVTVDSPVVLKHIAGSLILMTVIIGLGAPTRSATD